MAFGWRFQPPVDLALAQQEHFAQGLGGQLNLALSNDVPQRSGDFFALVAPDANVEVERLHPLPPFRPSFCRWLTPYFLSTASPPIEQIWRFCSAPMQANPFNCFGLVFFIAAVYRRLSGGSIHPFANTFQEGFGALGGSGTPKSTWYFVKELNHVV